MASERISLQDEFPGTIMGITAAPLVLCSLAILMWQVRSSSPFCYNSLDWYPSRVGWAPLPALHGSNDALHGGVQAKEAERYSRELRSAHKLRS